MANEVVDIGTVVFMIAFLTMLLITIRWHRYTPPYRDSLDAAPPEAQTLATRRLA